MASQWIGLPGRGTVARGLCPDDIFHEKQLEMLAASVRIEYPVINWVHMKIIQFFKRQ